MNSATFAQQFWNYCIVLRDDGMSYGGYVEQLTARTWKRAASSSR